MPAATADAPAPAAPEVTTKRLDRGMGAGRSVEAFARPAAEPFPQRRRLSPSERARQAAQAADKPTAPKSDSLSRRAALRGQYPASRLAQSDSPTVTLDTTDLDPARRRELSKQTNRKSDREPELIDSPFGDVKYGKNTKPPAADSGEGEQTGEGAQSAAPRGQEANAAADTPSAAEAVKVGEPGGVVPDADSDAPDEPLDPKFLERLRKLPPSRLFKESPGLGGHVGVLAQRQAQALAEPTAKAMAAEMAEKRLGELFDAMGARDPGGARLRHGLTLTLGHLQDRLYPDHPDVVAMVAGREWPGESMEDGVARYLGALADALSDKKAKTKVQDLLPKEVEAEVTRRLLDEIPKQLKQLEKQYRPVLETEQNRRSRADAPKPDLGAGDAPGPRFSMTKDGLRALQGMSNEEYVRHQDDIKTQLFGQPSRRRGA